RNPRGDRERRADRQQRYREFRIDLGAWRQHHDQRGGHRLRTCDDQWRRDAWIRRRILCRRDLRRGCSGSADAGARGGLHRNESGFSSNDQIDLANIGYATASLYNVTYNASTDLTTLVITDGTSTDTIRFAGNYTVHTAWHFSSDSNGGTLLTD